MKGLEKDNYSLSSRDFSRERVSLSPSPIYCSCRLRREELSFLPPPLPFASYFSSYFFFSFFLFFASVRSLLLPLPTLLLFSSSISSYSSLSLFLFFHIQLKGKIFYVFVFSSTNEPTIHHLWPSMHQMMASADCWCACFTRTTLIWLP